MKEEFAVKEIIKFNPFYGDSYEKELLTFSYNFTFFSYKDIAETLKDYKDFVILEYSISDNNKDYLKSKEYGHVWACDVTGLNMEKCLEKYIDLEKRNYDIVNTKAGAKYSIKKVYYLEIKSNEKKKYILTSISLGLIKKMELMILS
jgi:hypothetical protein